MDDNAGKARKSRSSMYWTEIRHLQTDKRSVVLPLAEIEKVQVISLFMLLKNAWGTGKKGEGLGGTWPNPKIDGLCVSVIQDIITRN